MARHRDRDLEEISSPSYEQFQNYSTSSGFLLDDNRLSLDAETLVNRALSRVLFGLCGEMDTESTQVLVPIHPIPSESLAQIPASPSFVARHTMPMDSVLDAGLEVHRNKAESKIGSVSEESDSAIPEPTDNSNRGQCWAGTGEYETLMEEMSSAVANKRFDGLSMSCLQDLYDKFAEVAQAVSTFPTRDGRNNPDGGGGTGGRSGATRNKESGGGGKLPAEVQDRVLRTLSEVRLQLDSVKNQLMRDKRLLS